jgi:hypothetical protein
MFEVLLTCLVLAGSTFIPPAGWEIQKIEAPHDWSLVYSPPGSLAYPEKRPTKVFLRRQMAPGERLEAPEHCQMSFQHKLESEHGSSVLTHDGSAVITLPSEKQP